MRNYGIEKQNKFQILSIELFSLNYDSPWNNEIAFNNPYKYFNFLNILFYYNACYQVPYLMAYKTHLFYPKMA